MAEMERRERSLDMRKMPRRREMVVVVIVGGVCARRGWGGGWLQRW